MLLSVKEDLSKKVIAISLIALSTIGLSACTPQAASVSGTYPDITLAESKSPAQLLRNEAASRIPAIYVDEVIEAQDTSVACLSEADDPDGVVRSWHSTVNVLMVDDGRADVKAIVKEFVASFVDQGWTARDLGGNAYTTAKLLESETSLADIQVTGFIPNPNQASTALEENVDQLTVRVEVHGPCVRTAGSTSDEVTALEKSKA